MIRLCTLRAQEMADVIRATFCSFCCAYTAALLMGCARQNSSVLATTSPEPVSHLSTGIIEPQAVQGDHFRARIAFYVDRLVVHDDKYALDVVLYNISELDICLIVQEIEAAFSILVANSIATHGYVGSANAQLDGREGSGEVFVLPSEHFVRRRIPLDVERLHDAIDCCTVESCFRIFGTANVQYIVQANNEIIESTMRLNDGHVPVVAY